MKYRVGDRVKCIYEDYPDRPYKKGWTGKFTEFGEGDFAWVEWDNGTANCIHLDRLTNIGGKMNKYEELKNRIEALDNGWDKDADDILKDLDIQYRIIISQDRGGGSGDVVVKQYFTLSEGYQNPDKCFDFRGQCAKNKAFKDAFLWLLDHSDIKKEEEKPETMIEIKGKKYSASTIQEALKRYVNE